jgi:3D (Asp-Asp-Asp) domain-containing protein
VFGALASLVGCRADDLMAPPPGSPVTIDARPVASVAEGDDAWLRVDGSREPARDKGPSASRFRNTYYDFPVEEAGAKERTLFDATCKPLAQVTRSFHDDVCVQGSGRVADGSTVSFAKRDCSCAEVCPRSNQRICFERLDPVKYPWGRGALGKPITPLRTVAVDPSVVPLGTSLYVRELAGLPTLDGRPHDGCFVAEDRGIKVVGAHLDVFTGSPKKTREWNARAPSNDGVTVELCSARCPLGPACKPGP